MRRRAVIQMIVIGLVTGLVSGAVAYFIPWLPDAASKEAGPIDAVYWFVAIICALIFALVAGVSIYAGWKFRAPPDDEDDGSPIHGHTGLEIVWTAVPAVLVTFIAVISAIVIAQNERTSEGDLEIGVTAQQFAWSFEYPNGFRSGMLRLPVDQTVVLRLTARDVIHSFFVPEFGQKQDAVPGIETSLVITPTKVGRYALACYELCGVGHALMRTAVQVMEQEAYDAWADKTNEAN